MRSSINFNDLDVSLLDPEHDMDLVAMLHNARTHDEIHHAIRVSRNRMRARAASNSAAGKTPAN